MLHSIYRKGRDMNISRIVPNTNLLRYLIDPPPASCNMFVEKNLSHVSLKFINPFKKTAGSRVIIRKN